MTGTRKNVALSSFSTKSEVFIMNQSTIILQNAKTQLEAEKKKVYNDAYNNKMNELRTDFDKYSAEQNKIYNDTVAQLKAAYDAAVAEKRKTTDNLIAARRGGMESEAATYANERASYTDSLIAQIDELIAKTEG